MSEAVVQTLGLQPRSPAIDSVERVRACLDIQGVDEPDDQVCGVTADVEADEVTGNQCSAIGGCVKPK